MQAKLILALFVSFVSIATFTTEAVGRPAQEAARATAVEPVTVILVRHAETAADTKTSRDPELSEAGQERAAALAELLSASGVTHVFASEYQRTQATVHGVAEAAGVDVTVVSAREPEAQLTAIQALPPGSVAVVAGHSNTVPGLIQRFGGTVENLHEDPNYGPMLAHDEYGRLFVVTLPAGEATRPHALELRYGQ